MRDMINCNLVKDYCRVTLKSKETNTLRNVMASSEDIEQWYLTKPTVTILSLGLSDIKMENVVGGHKPGVTFYNRVSP